MKESWVVVSVKCTTELFEWYPARKTCNGIRYLIVRKDHTAISQGSRNVIASAGTHCYTVFPSREHQYRSVRAKAYRARSLSRRTRYRWRVSLTTSSASYRGYQLTSTSCTSIWSVRRRECTRSPSTNVRVLGCRRSTLISCNHFRKSCGLLKEVDPSTVRKNLQSQWWSCNNL